MPKELPYMPFWIRDYRTDPDVRLMSIDARGLYIELIFELWEQQGFVKNSSKDLAILLRVSEYKFKSIFKVIEKKFIINDGIITHSRVTRELEKAYSKSEKAKMAADARWSRDANANANALPTQSHTTKTKSDSNKGKKKVVKKEKKGPSLFDVQTFEFWKTTLKKDNFEMTDERLKVIAAAIKRGHDHEKLNRAILAMSQDDWADRHKHNDVRNALAVIKGVDKVDYWIERLNTEPKLNPTNKYDTKGKDYGEPGILRL